MDIKLGIIGIEMEVYTFIFTNQCTKGRCVQSSSGFTKLESYLAKVLMKLILTPQLFILFRFLVQPRQLAWTLLLFRVHKSPLFFNWFRCTVQSVRLTNTGNVSSAPVRQVLLVWLARSRFSNSFQQSSLCQFHRTGVSDFTN